MKDSGTIVPLRGPDRVRKRPGLFFVSDGADGCLEMVLELFDRALREHQAGHAGRISVTMLRDGSLVIEDDGRGIPLDYDPETGICGWEEFFCGAFPRRERPDLRLPDAGRRDGLHHAPFAAAAPCRFLNALVFRDGFASSLRFQRGQPVRFVRRRCGGRHGTRLHFLPDDEVFSPAAVDFAAVSEYALRQAALHPGLTLTLKDLRTEAPERDFPSSASPERGP